MIFYMGFDEYESLKKVDLGAEPLGSACFWKKPLETPYIKVKVSVKAKEYYYDNERDRLKQLLKELGEIKTALRNIFRIFRGK
jgi:hypothetical protein